MKIPSSAIQSRSSSAASDTQQSAAAAKASSAQANAAKANAAAASTAKAKAADQDTMSQASSSTSSASSAATQAAHLPVGDEPVSLLSFVATVEHLHATLGEEAAKQFFLTELNTGKLENLKVQLQGFSSSALSKQEQMFGVGANVGNGPVSTLGQLKGSGGAGHATNPLRNSMQQNFAGSGHGHVSDGGDADGASTWERFLTWAGSVVGSILGGAGTSSGAGTVASGPAGAVGGTAFGILTANTGSPEEKKNEFFGLIRLRHHARENTSLNAGAEDQLNQVTYEVANPEATSRSPSMLTPESIRGVKGRLTERGAPVRDNSSGGPVNEQATPPGRVQTAGQPVDGWDTTAASTLTNENVKAVAARVLGDVNPSK